MASSVELLLDKERNAWEKINRSYIHTIQQTNVKYRTYSFSRVATLVDVIFQIIQANFEAFQVISHLSGVAFVVEEVLDAVQ